MSEDIVTRLRLYCRTNPDQSDYRAAMANAADEIERLRAEGKDTNEDIVTRLRYPIHTAPPSETGMRYFDCRLLMNEGAAEIDRLRAENSALNEIIDREGLRADWDERFDRNSPDPSYSSRRLSHGTDRT